MTIGYTTMNQQHFGFEIDQITYQNSINVINEIKTNTDNLSGHLNKKIACSENTLQWNSSSSTLYRKAIISFLM